MKSLIAMGFVAFVCVAGVKADDLQRFYWQVDSSTQGYFGSPYASVYAVLSDGQTVIWPDDMVVLTTEGKSFTDFGSYDLTKASFFSELYLENGDLAAKSVGTVTFESLSDYFRFGTSGSDLPPTTDQYYAFTYVAVPEPTSALLMLWGLAGLVLKRKKA